MAERVLVIGAGMGGLVAALALAARGVEVVVLERAAAPGGKMRTVDVAGAAVDAGPTVLTMRWVLEEILDNVGASLAQHLSLAPAEVLARHAWGAGETLDLFADRERTAEAIGTFAGAEDARAFREFCERGRHIYETLERSYIRAARPSLRNLARHAGIRGVGDLCQISAFSTLWRALEKRFRDARLQQLFGRYSTYVGSSPWQAPATLMLVAHVEQEGVWRVEGGMHRVARAFADLAAERGAVFRYREEVDEILVKGGEVCGARLLSGEELSADAVVVNADVAALSTGALGDSLRAAVPRLQRSSRSLSAVTWLMHTRASGFPLIRHNVFFSRAYHTEFDDIFRRRCLPSTPTVYVCAQDRGDAPPADGGPAQERLLCLVNAPPLGDRGQPTSADIERCEQAAFGLLKRCGLELERSAESTQVAGPQEFARLFPATGGALYGSVSHGWRSSFQRPGVRSRMPGLYLAGGSAHPGPGVPMAALSGQAAASCLLADLANR